MFTNKIANEEVTGLGGGTSPCSPRSLLFAILLCLPRRSPRVRESEALSFREGLCDTECVWEGFSGVFKYSINMVQFSNFLCSCPVTGFHLGSI